MTSIGNISFKGVEKLAKASSTQPKTNMLESAFTKCVDVFEAIISKRAQENQHLNKILASSPDPYDYENVWKLLSKEVHKICEDNFPEYYYILQNAFRDLGSQFTGRVKEQDSVLAKLTKRKDNILLLGQNILDNVPDLYGYKLVTNGKPGEIEKAVQTIEKLIDSGEVSPSHFINHGKNPYLNNDQITRLINKGFSHSEIIEKKEGFTGINLYFRDKFDTSTLELQITGDKTNSVNLKEHFFYNFKTKGAATEHGVVNEKFQSIFEAMKQDDIKAYSDYIDRCYLYTRAQEMGQKSEKPKLPEGLNKALELI